MSDFDERWRKLVDAARRAEDAEPDAVSRFDAVPGFVVPARIDAAARFGSSTPLDSAAHFDSAEIDPVELERAERRDSLADRTRAGRIAMMARREVENRARIRREWRGLVVAASVFVACLLALAFSAHALGFEPKIGDARHELSRLARSVPDTSFVPSPPRLADLGLPTLAQIGPKLTSWPGANFLTSIDHWFTSTPSNAEISR